MRYVTKSTAFIAVAAAVLLMACAPRGPLATGSTATPSMPGSTLPVPRPFEIADAIELRESLGLRADEEYVIAVANDPSATSDLLGIPLLPHEAREIARRNAMVNEAAEVFQEYGRTHADEYAGMYIDQRAGGAVVVLFTADVDEHQRGLEALVSDHVDVRTRLVRYTQAELLEVMEAIPWEELREDGIEILSVSLDTRENEVDVEAKSDDPTAEATLEALYPGMVEAVVHPFPGPWSHVEAGEGWRLLATGETDGGEAYTVAAALDAPSGRELWSAARLEGELPPVDWDREIVVSFLQGIGGGCNEVRLDDVVIDHGLRAVYPVTSDPLQPRNCDLSLTGSVAFVVALDRDALPASPFTVQISDRVQPCPSGLECEPGRIIEVSVP